VCDGAGTLYLNCKMQGAGFPGQKSGCDATPGEASAATVPWVLLLLFGLLAARQKLPLR
jgi:MYXO-CTERM domain-containing protein